MLSFTHPAGLRLSVVFLAFFAGIVFAQENVTVLSSNSTISYVGNWVDQDNGGHKFATGDGCSLSFPFYGTAIYYHSVINPNGGVAQITLDGVTQAQVDESDLVTNTTAPPIPAVLFSKTNLGPKREHVFVLNYSGSGKLGGGYVEVYSLQYTTDPDGSGGSGGSAGDSSGGGTNKGALIGGVVGGVVGGILITLLVGFLCLRRKSRNQKPEDLEPKEGSVAPYTLEETDVRSTSTKSYRFTTGSSGFLPSSYPSSPSLRAQNSAPQAVPSALAPNRYHSGTGSQSLELTSNGPQVETHSHTSNLVPNRIQAGTQSSPTSNLTATPNRQPPENQSPTTSPADTLHTSTPSARSEGMRSMSSIVDPPPTYPGPPARSS